MERDGRRAIDCAKRWAKPDHTGPRGSQNQAGTRDVEQPAQMLDRLCLHRRLPDDFVATLELSEQLIVEIVPVGEKNQRRIFRRRLFNAAIFDR